MIEFLNGVDVSVSATTLLLALLTLLTLLSAALGRYRRYRPTPLESLEVPSEKSSKKTVKAAVVPVVVISKTAERNGRLRREKDEECVVSKGAPPGPWAWPVIGSLHLLGQYEVPFEAFSSLSRIYGDLFSITLGSTPCVVVNSLPLIKEVLITKGPHFGGRPNFIRYDILFGGDRDNCKYLSHCYQFEKKIIIN